MSSNEQQLAQLAQRGRNPSMCLEFSDGVEPKKTGPEARFPI